VTTNDDDYGDGGGDYDDDDDDPWCLAQHRIPITPPPFQTRTPDPAFNNHRQQICLIDYLVLLGHTVIRML